MREGKGNMRGQDYTKMEEKKRRDLEQLSEKDSEGTWTNTIWSTIKRYGAT